MPDQDTPATPARFLTLKQVAKELAVSESQIRTILLSGELPAIQIGPKRVWRIERARLEQYIDERYQAAARAAEPQPEAEDDEE